MFFWLFIITFASGQEVLTPIEVNAPRGPLIQQSSVPLWRASEEQMQERAQVQDVLTRAPGVTFVQDGGVGGRGSIYLRGGESRHTVVLVDGMRLNDPSVTDRQYDPSFLLLPFFQDLLLLRGPAPTLYGSDATSGVIELVPRRGREPRETIISLSGGSFDTFHGFALQDWGQGSHLGSVGVSHIQTRGFSRLNRKRHGASEADGALSTQIFQASTHKWGKLETDLLVYGLTGRAEFDGATADNDDFTDNLSGTLAQTTRGKWQSNNWWLRSGIVSQERELHGSSDISFAGQTRQVQVGMQSVSGKLALTGGVSAEQEWLSVPSLNASNDLVGVFLLSRWTEKRWLLELGTRGEHHQRYGEFLTGEGTFRWFFSDTMSAHVKTGLGYKAPSLYQLYAPPIGFQGGNRDLDPEKNLASEIGVVWKSFGEVSVIAFQQDFKNLIVFTPSGVTGYENRGTLRVQGVEASVLSPEHAWGQIGVTGTWLDFSHYQSTPLRRAPYGLNAHWVGSWGKWGSELSLKAIGGRRDVVAGGGTQGLTAYELLSGALKWSPVDQQQWVLRAGNLTDRDYEDVWGYGVAPLNASLQWIGRY